MSELDPEAEALLAKARRVFLFTLRADGSPTAHPMTGNFVGGRLAFSTYRKAVKTRNAQRDPRTCSLALEGYAGAGPRAGCAPRPLPACGIGSPPTTGGSTAPAALRTVSHSIGASGARA